MKGSSIHGRNAIKTVLVLAAIVAVFLAGIGGWATASAQQGQPAQQDPPAPAATAVPGEVVQQDEQTANIAPSQQAPGTDKQAAALGDSSTLLGSGSYSSRIYWGFKNGWWVLTLYDSRITANSRVYVSLSEVDASGNRFVGAARYSVYNIAPRNGAVTIRVLIDWGSPLRTVADYLVVQP